MKYQTILFDADGTLLDYRRAEERSFRKTLLAFDIEPAAELIGLYRRINGELWRQVEEGRITPDQLRVQRFARLLEEAGLDAQAQALADAYVALLAQSGDTVTGARGLLEALHGRARLALVTNGTADIQRRRIRRSGLNRFFSVVVISDEVGAAKPDSRFFDETFRRLKRPAREEVLIVGDSLTSDIRGGAAYGIDTCWFNPERRPPEPGYTVHYEITRLVELLDTIGWVPD